MGECKIKERLVQLRCSKGLTQKSVAESICVSDKTLSKWENGTSEPSLDMLLRLAEFYDVSTDFLIGKEKDSVASPHNVLNTAFKGLNRRESVLRAFELVRSLVPATFNKFLEQPVDVAQTIPSTVSRCSRCHISAPDFFDFSANNEEVNIAVMMLRNSSDFAWLKDTDKQKKIVRIFRFLSDEDTLSVMYFLHSVECSENFTADYVSKNTRIDVKKAEAILDELCSVGWCLRVTAHLEEGTVNVYECFGDGIMMSMIALACEHSSGRKVYDYNLNGRCKMIGGK